MKQCFSLMLLGILLHPAALAEVYVGGGIARTDFDLSSFDDATGFNLRGGWQYSPYVAFEGSYWDSGDADSDYWSFDLSGDAFLLGGRFSTDVRRPFQAYARVGLGLWDLSGGGESDDGADLYYAIGAAYTANMARYFVEYQNLEIETDGLSFDVSSVGAGFEYRYGIAGTASFGYQSPRSSERIRKPYGFATSQSRNYRNGGSKGRFYFGGGIGRSDIDTDGFDDPTGFNIRGGWMYNPYLALETSYFKSGKSDDDYGPTTWYIEGDALQFGIRYGTHIRQPWHFYTRVGLAFWDFEVDQSRSGLGKYSEDGSDIYFGAGVAYAREASRYFLEFQRMLLDTEDENTDVDTLSVGFEYRCCSRSVASNSYVSKPQTLEAPVPNQVSYESNSAQTMLVSANSAVIVESLDPVDSDEELSDVEASTYFPEEEVVVTAPAPVHPMKIAIQEGCNVVSVKVVDESEVWDLFCPSTLKRITVTI